MELKADVRVTSRVEAGVMPPELAEMLCKCKHTPCVCRLPWRRYRFVAPGEDWRPVKWPPQGPYWCTGYRSSDDAATLVAYLPAAVALREWWPEAEEIESTAEAEITFTDRFPKPDWWA